MDTRLSRRLLLGVVGAGGVAALGAAAFGFGRNGEAPPSSAGEVHTAEIVRGDLNEERILKGRLGYGVPATLVGQLGGFVTGLAATGATIGRGGLLYRVDDRPVVLMLGGLPAWRSMSAGTEGRDVQQLKANLRAMGDLKDKATTVFDWATTSAVKRWQRRVGLEDNGVIELGRVVFLPAPVRIAQHKVTRGQSAQGEVLTYTGTDRAVTLNLTEADRELAIVGHAVRIGLPGGATVDGKVDSSVSVPGRNGADELAVTIALTSQDRLPDGEPSVDVRFSVAHREGVLIAPVTALLALREGGYGLEVAEETGTRVVAVEVGLFAQGRVEVSGDGLAEGVRVVVP